MKRTIGAIALAAVLAICFGQGRASAGQFGNRGQFGPSLAKYSECRDEYYWPGNSKLHSFTPEPVVLAVNARPGARNDYQYVRYRTSVYSVSRSAYVAVGQWSEWALGGDMTPANFNGDGARWSWSSPEDQEYRRIIVSIQWANVRTGAVSGESHHEITDYERTSGAEGSAGTRTTTYHYCTL